jgi:hypothetical protein
VNSIGLKRWPVWVNLVVAALALIAVVAVVTRVRGISGDREGVDWSHSELFKYLESKGIPIWPAPSSPTSKGLMVRIKSDQSTAAVYKCDSQSAAHDVAGSDYQSAFAWGRFVFSGKDELIAKIRAVLP